MVLVSVRTCSACVDPGARSRAGRFHDRVVKSPGRAQVVRYASGEVRDVPEIWPEMRSGTWLHYEPLVEIVDIEKNEQLNMNESQTRAISLPLSFSYN